jgi:hypothetical protein
MVTLITLIDSGGNCELHHVTATRVPLSANDWQLRAAVCQQ